MTRFVRVIVNVIDKQESVRNVVRDTGARIVIQNVQEIVMNVIYTLEHVEHARMAIGVVVVHTSVLVIALVVAICLVFVKTVLMVIGGWTVLVNVLKDAKPVFNIQVIVQDVQMVYGARIVLDIAEHLGLVPLLVDKQNAICMTDSAARDVYRVIGDQTAPTHVILMTARKTYAIKVVVNVQNVKPDSGEATAVLHVQLRTVQCAQG